VDNASWAALALSLTVLGAIWTWWSFQRRGLASGLRALAFTLLPVAAYLTRTLRLITRIAEAVADWAASLVFNPLVWSGVIVAGISAVLFVVSGALRSRELAKGGGRTRTRGSRELPAPDSSGRRGTPAVSGDDDLAEIEALLRKRGIS
jgi:hypothetical protein